jgi:hypothetical protein
MMVGSTMIAARDGSHLCSVMSTDARVSTCDGNVVTAIYVRRRS